jgi:hypothetical protein
MLATHPRATKRSLLISIALKVLMGRVKLTRFGAA